MTESSRKIPLVILAGSDCKLGPVPRAAKRLHFVAGYKGADFRIGEKCLAQILVRRARDSGAFGKIYLVGPGHIFDSLVDCEVIDSDGSLGHNLEAAVKAVLAVYGDDAPVAFMACDILPQPREIAELAAQLTCEDSSEPSDAEPLPALALPLIYGSRELGASSWKPKYPFCPAPGAQPIAFLPGHLGVIRASRLRTGLLFRVLQIAYDERNRDDYDRRGRRFVLRILGSLLLRDLLNILRLRGPSLTYTVLRYGLGAFRRWRRRLLDLEGLALGMAGVVVRRRYFRRWGAENVRLVTSPFVSFAKDLDTREELEELYRDFEGQGKD